MEDIEIVDQQIEWLQIGPPYRRGLIVITDAETGHVIVSLSASDVDKLAGKDGLCYIFEVSTASGVSMRATGELTVVATDSEHGNEE